MKLGPQNRPLHSPGLNGVPDPQKMVENGDNYCTALKRNMGRSAHGNFVQ